MSLRTSATTACASGGLMRAARRRPHHFAAHVDPAHRRAVRVRAFQRFVIGGDAQAAAIEMAVGERDDVAMRAVVVAQVDDVFVAAETARQVEQRVHRVGPRGAGPRPVRAPPESAGPAAARRC